MILNRVHKHIFRMFCRLLLWAHPAGKTQSGKIKPTWTHTIMLQKLYFHTSSSKKRPHLRPGVHHIHEVAAGIGPQDGLQHLLVFQAASAETWQRLAAPTDGSLQEKRFRPQKRMSTFFNWTQTFFLRENTQKSSWMKSYETLSSLACSVHINQPQNFSFVHLIVSGERPRDHCVISPSLTHEPKRRPFVRCELQTLDPQLWEADLAHIKHSQLSSQGLIKQIKNVQCHTGYRKS